MTYADFLENVSTQEFDMWLALASVRADECPHCGVEPTQFMDFELADIRCPNCKQTYHKTKAVKLPERAQS
jgi:uncharacterized protein (DUF983 family)